jgi:hypothetical protein
VSGLPWGKFWWKDWLTDPALSVCSLAAQGLWMRMLCIMSMSEPPGHLIIPPTTRKESEAKQVARMCLADARQVRALLAELETRRVFSREKGGIIVSRRMIRDAELSDKGRVNAAKKGQHPKGQPRGQPRGVEKANGQPKGHGKANPTARTDADADSPPKRPRASRSRKPEAKPDIRNGFTASATDDMQETVDAEKDHPPSGGASVVPIARHLVRR